MLAALSFARLEALHALHEHSPVTIMSLRRGIENLNAETMEWLLTLFWVHAIALTLLRRVSASVQHIAAYGGRSSVAIHEPAHEGILLRLSYVPRKRAFQAFYLTGLVVGFACVASLLRHCVDHELDASVLLPLALMLSHCWIRFAETTFRQRFRLDDTVTLFAAASGCVFYLASLLSSVPWSAVRSRESWHFTLDSSAPTFVGSSIALAVASWVHLFVQYWQWKNHEVLRRLRCGTKQHRQTRYRFPTGKGMFRLVLEPHYLCEILMYLVQFAVFVEGFRGSGAMAVLPSTLALVFTCVNLGITAAEHRAYWIDEGAVDEIPKWNLVPGLF